MVTEKPHLLLIADLRHASPRWPSLGGALLLDGWDVTVVSAPLGADAADRLGFPSVFAQQATLIEVGPAEDLLEPLRRFLWKFGMRRNQSLTGQLSEVISTRTGRLAVRGLGKHVEALLGWPDIYSRWVRPASDSALELLREQRVTAMVSSSPYPSAHVAASRVKKRRPDIRWVADFRDLWINNHSNPGVLWRRGIDRFLEKRVVSRVDVFVAPTSEWASSLGALYDKPSAFVPNGFVDYGSHVELAAPKPPRSPFTLLYTGVRYVEHQRIDLICEAIRILKNEGVINQQSFQFLVYGPLDAELQHVAKGFGVSELIHIEPPISRRAAQGAQAQADALLFYQWDDEGKTNWISSLKLHEYVGSGRPILATGGFLASAVSNLLHQTGRAGVCFTAEQTADWLRKRIGDWQKGESAVLSSDWTVQAKQLSGISRGIPALEWAIEYQPFAQENP